MQRWLLIAAVVAGGCGGSGTPVTSPGPAPAPTPESPETEQVSQTPEEQPEPAQLRPPETPPDREPEVFPPAWKTVGVGQKISFAVTAIDQDLDETRVLVTAMPPTATFDALTQTVTWTPSKKDMPAGKFELEVANLDDAGNPTRTWKHTWEIAVAKKKQPPPVPDKQSTVVETLLTIREPARLAAVNKAWPLDKMLVRTAEMFRATLPPEQQAKLGKLDKKALFASFLAGMAETHGNQRFVTDKKMFGDPKAWKIVAVRPRIDKKWTELRVAYQNVRSPEPVFAMFRVRPTWDVPTLPAEARAYNNKVFLDLVSTHLLDQGKPSEKLMKNAKAHGKAVAALVAAVLSYDDSKTNPWARAGFSALPTEARMGGGSRRNDDGSYRSGDAWAWSVMKPMVNADGTAQAWVNIGIPGFWTATAASPDGTAWVGKCAPKFDPDDPKHAPGYEVLCRKAQGFVDLPATKDGKIVSSKIDAVNLFVDHKRTDAVALLALDDGRRDHGEENGMTCAQCHIRNFTVRDYGDAATADPKAGTPRAPNAPIPTLDFQIIPGTHWPAFTLDFMKDQECKGMKQMEQFLGKPSGLTCPLAPPAQ
jgi:hypothetical protein